MANQEIPPHDAVRKAFRDGSIINASKEQLELFLISNGQARQEKQANQVGANEMGETMRQLLAARQSQEMHTEALRISKVALFVSVAALVVAVPGAIASLWPFVFPSPTQVYAAQPIPVRLENGEELLKKAKAPATELQEKQPPPPSEKSSQGSSKN